MFSFAAATVKIPLTITFAASIKPRQAFDTFIILWFNCQAWGKRIDRRRKIKTNYKGFGGLHEETTVATVDTTTNLKAIVGVVIFF